MSKLTAQAIDRLKPPAERRELPDGLIPGLYLVCQPSGARSWAVRYRSSGKPRKMTIGTYPAIGLATARELARTALVAVASGRDPGLEKVEARRAVPQRERDTIERCAALYVERYAKANTREGTWRETERTLSVNFVSAWRGRLVQDITRRDVIEVLDSIVDRGAPIQANRALAVVRHMFGWLRGRGVIERNPCDDVKSPSAERSRDRVLTNDELRALWRACDGLGEPFGPLVRLLILTGQRRDEVAHMTWSEVDLGASLWTIPRERSKNGTAHDVPLSAEAVAILAGMTRVAGDKGFVFTTTGKTPVSGFSRAKQRLDVALPDLPPWVLHDLRRTLSSGMARLRTAPHIIEAVLNHLSGTVSGVAAVYNRHHYGDEKRDALATWGRFVEALVADVPIGNVIELRANR